MVNRVIVGAHYGLRGWLVQRVSAVVMALYVVVLLLSLVVAHPSGFSEWRGLFGSQPMKLITFLFIVSLLLHSWVGIRDIFMDYIKPVGLRFTLEAVVVIALVAWGGWGAQILWSL